ncbi:MAG: selenium metabolism-associated LysR family transcriptional regulator [Bacillota bacterium]|jgi:DNA-binding transcriptional LysR family regulator
MTSLKQLSIFASIVEKGSFTAAAESLFMTQPAISWQIKKLEEDLEVSLFKKKDRNLELSEAGEIVYRAAKEMVGVYSHVLNTIKNYKDMNKGRLNIGASSIPGEYILPHLLYSFSEEHNKLEIKMQIDASVNILEKLSAAQIDIGIVGTKKALPEIEYFPWLEDEIIAVTAAGNQEIPDKATLADMVKYTMVGRGVQSGTRIAIDQALDKENLSIDSFPKYVSITTTQGLLNAVAAGMGFAFVSRWAANPMIKQGSLKKIDIKKLTIKRNFYIAKWKTPYPVPGVDAFAEFLLNADIKNENS